MLCLLINRHSNRYNVRAMVSHCNVYICIYKPTHHAESRNTMESIFILGLEGKVKSFTIAKERMTVS